MEEKMKQKKVAIIMGSRSDLPEVEKAAKVLSDLGIEYEMRIISAHRTPDTASEFAQRAESEGFDLIIAAAGKAAHLAGVMAAGTVLPVIGIPMKTGDLGGMDSLLSTVQMPKGVPVATVAIGGAENAAILAAQILSCADSGLRAALKEYRKKMAEEVAEADRELNK